jgi:type III restriction enzyme
LGEDVHKINVLTVIASESYDSFAKGLQAEIAEAVADRPRAVTVELFVGKVIKDDKGNEQVIDQDTAFEIHYDMIVNGYIDRKGALTDKYYADKANGEVKLAEKVADSAASVLEIIDSIYDSRTMLPENGRKDDTTLTLDKDKLAMPEFKALWSRINAKSIYVVDFDTNELIKKAIYALDNRLLVSKIYFKVESGVLETISSRESLESGASFVREKSAIYSTNIAPSGGVKYDLIGKLVDETGLTRKTIVKILQGIHPLTFNKFKDNPEEFIIKAAALINDEKATTIIQHITYNVLDERYDTDVFTEPTLRGRLGKNVMKAHKHLYDHILYDSSNEERFAKKLDTNTNVAVYVKLPGGFYISTPVGRYNPDWAIAFYEGAVKHVYFVAETKGSMSSLQLRQIEASKIHCAKEHFKAISNGEVVYDVVDSYEALWELVTK